MSIANTSHSRVSRPGSNQPGPSSNSTHFDGLYGDQHGSEDYTELLCSLPHLVDPFRYQSNSISLVQLEKRMNMLNFEDFEWVRHLRALFYWGGILLDVNEAGLVKKANRFLAHVPYRDIRAWLLWRMDIRTILAAMRRRKAGEKAPTAATWGYGRYLKHIQTHWSSPCFKLEYRYPFLPAIYQHLSKGESYKLEQALLKAIWHYYSTRMPNQAQGFSAVVLYAMKWDLVDRWRQYDADLGAVRFNALVDSCLPATLDF